MEVSILRTAGLEDDSIVSIRLGSVRRQAPVDSKKPFIFPATKLDSNVLKVDVYKPIARRQVNVGVDDETYTVKVPTAPGTPAKELTLQVKSSLKQVAAMDTQPPSHLEVVDADDAADGCGLDNLGLEACMNANNPNAAATAAKAYIDKFKLLEGLQELLVGLLHEKPDDPFIFLASKIRQRSGSREEQVQSQQKQAPLQPHPATALPAEDECDAAISRSQLSLIGAGSEAMTAASAALTCQNARLTGEISRLNEELHKLTGKCVMLGMNMPPQLESNKVEGDPAAAACALFPDTPMSTANRGLLVEHEELRSRLTHLALKFADFVSTEATAAKALIDQLKEKGADSKKGGVIPADKSDGWNAAHLGAYRFNSHTSNADDDDDGELIEEPRAIVRKRGRGISAEAYGAWNNRRAAFVPPVHKKTEEQRRGLMSAFTNCPLFGHVCGEVLNTVVNTMVMETVPASKRIVKQGDDGDCLFVLLRGTVACYDEKGEAPRLICNFKPGRIFGELAMLYNTPRTLSIYCGPDGPCVLARLGRSIYQNLVFRDQMKIHENREECLRRVRNLDTMSAEQIAQLGDILEKRVFQEGEMIVQQGDAGDEFFIVQEGECSATVVTGSGDEDDVEADIQEHRRYYRGDLFGEQAILKSTVRQATVTALSYVEVMALPRAKFERMFGPLNLLQQHNYKRDPRQTLAEFYRFGDQRGPYGTCALHDSTFVQSAILPEKRTDWFSVFRPTSRDAIAKMLAGHATGKGLNVKGKSAKRGRLSGFVPFLQISVNDHKKLLEKPHANARIRIFYNSEADRERMLKVFEPLLNPEDGCFILGDRVIFYIDLYPDVFGLDIPEPVLREVYIERADITFQAGWETGRKSEPAFMDMNSYALRGHSEPRIVLYQRDHADCMNPHGLLIAYAEKTVKPVVSDFDTFLVGSRGMTFADLPLDQAELIQWALENTQAIMENPGPGSWTSRWLDVIKQASEEGFYPKIPKYGFGDATSYELVKDVVTATQESGAVRHGAECFNFFFPQELDDEYLVVWEGFQEQGSDKPWEYLDEDDLREFLIQRARAGFAFPLNPVWPVRDPGWFDVYQELVSTEHGKACLKAFLPESLGLLKKIDTIHEDFPDGFLPNGNGMGSSSRKSVNLDLDSAERANLVMGQGRDESKLKNAFTTVRAYARIKLCTRMVTDYAVNGGVASDEEEGFETIRDETELATELVSGT